MASPNFRDHRIYMVPLLRVLQRRGACRPADVYDEVADLVGVTPDQRAIEGGEGSWNPVYRNRIQFARQALIDAGVVLGSTQPGWQRGVWQLAPEGDRLGRATASDAALDAILRERALAGIRRRTLEREESRALAGLSSSEEPKQEEEEDVTDSAEADSRPDVAFLVDAANDLVLRTMLEHVRSMSDRAFEHLVGTVLKAALRAESVTVEACLPFA
jgi:restriction endonuclease Mrr